MTNVNAKPFVAYDAAKHGDYRTSRYDGICRWCGLVYHPGDKVNWNPRVKGTCCHAGCYKEYGSPVGSRPLSTPTDAIVLDEVDFVPPPTTIANKTLGDGATIGETILDNIRQYLDGRLTGLVNQEQVQKAIDKALDGKLFKVVHTVTVNQETDFGYETKDLGVQHKCFSDLLDFLKARDLDGYRLNVLMKGPAGSGKTTAAKHCAKALGLSFHFTGSIDTEYKLLGFTTLDGKTVRTPFREAWEFGGLFLFDEMDGSLAPAVLAMNAALANHACAFPDGVIPQHKDCVIVAATNTWGLGGDNDYVGRTKLDKASLDRFIGLEWEYDEELEVALNGGAEWVKRVQTVRANIKARGIQVIVSPRASMYGLAMLKVGIPQEKVEKATLAKGMTAQQWESVK